MEAYKQLEEQFEFLNVRLEETNRDLRDSLERRTGSPTISTTSSKA
jgi:hypothetical protein